MSSAVNVGKWTVIGLVAIPLIWFGRLIEWGYHKESGLDMAGELLSWKLPRSKPDKARAFASDVCGEPADFFRTDPTSYDDAMPEQTVARHFTLYGHYRNIIWVVVGAQDKFCLARYDVSMRKHDCAWPFPYCNRWSWTSVDEARLINRIQVRPQVPPGVRAILPGECVTGRLEAGEMAKFQVEIPSFGQQVEVFAFGDNARHARLQVGISKDGRPERDSTGRQYVDEDGGGMYLIALTAPATDFKFYRLKTYWGGTGPDCRDPIGWRETNWADPEPQQAKP